MYKEDLSKKKSQLGLVLKTSRFCSPYANSKAASKALQTIAECVWVWDLLVKSRSESSERFMCRPARVTHKHHLKWQDFLFIFYSRWRTSVALWRMNVTIGSHLVLDCWKLVHAIVLKVWHSVRLHLQLQLVSNKLHIGL